MNEIREDAPRLRLVGAFPPRKHTTVGFTPEVAVGLSAGRGIEIPAVVSLTEPARADYINKPRTDGHRPTRTDGCP
jgi:hypothetical protein